jgi:hypothetical protein
VPGFFGHCSNHRRHTSLNHLGRASAPIAHRIADLDQAIRVDLPERVVGRIGQQVLWIDAHGETIPSRDPTGLLDRATRPPQLTGVQIGSHPEDRIPI